VQEDRVQHLAPGRRQPEADVADAEQRFDAGEVLLDRPHPSIVSRAEPL